MSTFKPKIVAFCCNWGAYQAADLAGISGIQYKPDVRIIRVMCSGRIDPVIIAEAFSKGADGVFCGTCLADECRNITGNVQTESKVYVTSLVLERAGILPRRLTLKMISPADSKYFVNHISEFINEITSLGKIGKGENLKEDEFVLKMEAVTNVLYGKKIRWLAGKRSDFKNKGNFYREVFTSHELDRMFKEVVMDEYDSQEMLLRVKQAPLTVKDLSQKMNLPSHRVLRQMANMRKMGLVDIAGVIDGSPLWRFVEKGNELITNNN